MLHLDAKVMQPNIIAKQKLQKATLIKVPTVASGQMAILTFRDYFDAK